MSLAEPMLSVAAGLLARQYGLDAAAIGPTVLATALDDAAGTLGLTRTELAVRLAEPACVSALFNALPVGLSWFDRDAAQLRAAAAWAARRRGPIRVLSAPCARGEEVWSLAASMLDAGVEAHRFQILGLDAMPAAIDIAESGAYPLSAIGGRDRPWWLPEIAGQLRVHPRLRSSVRFRTANLLDPAALADLGRFDLIFSRNFLIYLTPVARDQWIARLDELLVADGRLYVAASEPLGAGSARFRSCVGEVPGASERAEIAAPASAAESLGVPRATELTPPIRPRVRAVAAQPSASAPVTAGSAESLAAQDPRALADAGALDAAETALEARLASAMPAAADLVTAALIALARGQSARAEDMLRQALYLEHGHPEAVDLLAVLLDQRGEAGGARRLRARSGARA